MNRHTPSSVPTRTCVGCRGKAAATSLLRLRRRSDGAIVVDLEGRRPGRSAWICARRSCVDSAIKRRGFTRALAGTRGLAVRVPEAGALWDSLGEATRARLDVLRRTAIGAGSAKLSTFTALQQQLAVGEVS